MKLRTLAILLSLVVTFPAVAAKTIGWERMSVRAHLDAEGRMHVTEELAMRFTGDWNGGERTFRIEDGQELAVAGMARIAANGTRHEMVEGDLVNVDDWQLQDRRLRWRSREQSDPPFDATLIVYEIRYSIANVLVPRIGEGGFILAHDFAFPDRDEPIERFDVQLTFAPEWKREAIKASETDIDEGDGFVIKTELDHSGAVAPVSRPLYTRLLTLLRPWAVLLPSAILLLFFLLRELLVTARIRKETSNVDRAWLDEHVFRFEPEVAGALLDGKVEASEVAAMLARMELEGKIRSRIDEKKGGGNLHLELVLPQPERTEREGILIQAIFGEKVAVNTRELRSKSQVSGFDLPAKIRQSVMDDVALVVGSGRWSNNVTSLLVVLTIALLGYAIWLNPNEFVLIFLIVFGGIGVTALGVGAAEVWLGARNAMNVLKLSLPGAAMGLLTATCQKMASSEGMSTGFSTFGLLSVGVALLMVYRYTLNWARSGLPGGALIVQRRMELARDWFRKQLDSTAPQLDDAWMPWLIALGLNGDVERWWKSYGPAEERKGRASTSSESGDSDFLGSSSTPSPASSGFSAGAGRFGGAGATASWGTAATAFAAPISAPGSGSSGSSSSSGSSWSSSSSSSSSSSGGGGGGGW